MLPLAIFMRHGQAENNIRRILVGRYKESHLTEEGKQQVSETAELLKNMSVDKIISSPVTRTIETTEIVSKILKLDYSTDERLYEIDLGTLAGTQYDEVIEKHGDLFLEFYLNKKNSVLESHNVESFSSVRERIKNLLDEIMMQYRTKNVLLVTHLDPIKAAISNILELSPSALYNWHMRNAALTILKNDYGYWTISGVNFMGSRRYLRE